LNLAVGNASGCNLKFYPYFLENGADPNDDPIPGEPCFIPNGEVTVCVVEVPEEHFVRMYHFWNEADENQQHLFINFPCTQNEMNWFGIEICETDFFVDVNMSDCEQIKFAKQ
jgi:hypothetical protein